MKILTAPQLRRIIKEVIEEVEVTRLPPAGAPSDEEGQRWFNESDLSPEQRKSLQTALDAMSSKRSKRFEPLNVSMCSFEPRGGDRIECSVRGRTLLWNGKRWVPGARRDVSSPW